MAEDFGGGQERTEQPTAHRRKKARAEGTVARSADISAAIVLLGGVFTLTAYGGAGFGVYLQRLFNESMGFIGSREIGPPGMAILTQFAVRGFLGAFLPFAIGLCAVIILVNAIQTGGLVSLHLITPNWSRLDPSRGFRRLFSGESVFNSVKAALKFAALAVITYMVLARCLPALTSLSSSSPAEIISIFRGSALRLVIFVGLAYLALAGIDYGYQFFRTEKNLRMSRQEIRHEMKETEGDPLIKQRIQSLARSRARQRMLQKVPQADVIIVNPTTVAVALKYDVAIAPAPIVLAMGQRKLAERIRTIARRADVPIVENRTVARALLATAKVGRAIPPALYAAVAEILAVVYRQRVDRSGLPPGWSIGRSA